MPSPDKQADSASQGFLPSAIPKLRRLSVSTCRIKQLTPESREHVSRWTSLCHVRLTDIRCLHRLASYRPPKSVVQVPSSRRAAVLVALFVGRTGDLYVLLSRYAFEARVPPDRIINDTPIRRSATLRTYAGDTSLPGGKMDSGDRNIEETAVRLPRAAELMFSYLWIQNRGGRLSKRWEQFCLSPQYSLLWLDWTTERSLESSPAVYSGTISCRRARSDPVRRASLLPSYVLECDSSVVVLILDNTLRVSVLSSWYDMTLIHLA